MSKSKKALETSLDLMSSFKASVDKMVEGLVSSVNYLESWCWKFVQRNMAEADVCRACTFRSLDCSFSSCTDFLDR